MTINYAIIENEEYAKRMLEHSISTLRPDYRLVFTSDNIADTVDWLATRADVDLIFMDIELDDGNCFDIFNQVRVDTPVIFTTAYDDYAIKAFKVNSVDYLLKPVKQSELQTALTKMEALHPQVSQRVLLRAHGGMTSAPGNTIAGFVSEDKIVYAYMTDGRSILTDFPTLKDVMGRLDAQMFFQLSRNAIVNIHSIVTVNRYSKSRLEVVLRWGNHEESFIVSFERRGDFLKWYAK